MVVLVLRTGRQLTVLLHIQCDLISGELHISVYPDSGPQYHPHRWVLTLTIYSHLHYFDPLHPNILVDLVRLPDNFHYWFPLFLGDMIHSLDPLRIFQHFHYLFAAEGIQWVEPLLHTDHHLTFLFHIQLGRLVILVDHNYHHQSDHHSWTLNRTTP